MYHIYTCIYKHRPIEHIAYSNHNSRPKITTLNSQINSFGPSDAIWCWISWSTLIQVMAFCLMAPSPHDPPGEPRQHQQPPEKTDNQQHQQPPEETDNQEDQMSDTS